MEKIYVFLVLLFISPLRGAEPDEIFHKKCLYPVIKITPQSSDAHGSGVIIRSEKMAENEYRNVFLTCGHVVDDEEEEPYFVWVYNYKDWSVLDGHKKYRAVFYDKSPDCDIAVGVFLSDKKMPTAYLDFNTRLYIGSKVFGIGCGAGDVPRLEEGKITAVRTDLGSFVDVLRTNVMIIPGDSGSPLFHNNKVVGVRIGYRNIPRIHVINMSYVEPLEHLLNWDKKTGGRLDFMWKKKEMPNMPFYSLKHQILPK